MLRHLVSTWNLDVVCVPCRANHSFSLSSMHAQHTPRAHKPGAKHAHRRKRERKHVMEHVKCKSKWQEPRRCSLWPKRARPQGQVMDTGETRPAAGRMVVGTLGSAEPMRALAEPPSRRLAPPAMDLSRPAPGGVRRPVVTTHGHTCRPVGLPRHHRFKLQSSKNKV